MYCTECGTKNDDGMQFCVQCGAPLDSAQVDLSSQPLEPTQSALGNRLCNVSTTRRSRQPKKRTRIIVAAMIAALVACGGASYYFGVYMPQSKQTTKKQKTTAAEYSKHSVLISVSGDGWNTSEGASKLPIRVKGTDVNGSKIDKTAFVDSDGKGLELIPGTYGLVIEGTPIGADGSLWNVSDSSVKFKVKRALKDGEKADFREMAKLTLGDKIDPADVTDEQINAAEKLAERGGCDSKSSAKALAAAARGARDAAVSAKQAEDASAAQKRAEQEAENAKKAVEQNESSTSSLSEISPFWGAFVMASKDYTTSEKKADDLRNSGFPGAIVVCTTDWTNLNKETWYSVSAGRFSSRTEAEQAVSALKNQGISDAYVRYSGDHQ